MLLSPNDLEDIVNPMTYERVNAFKMTNDKFALKVSIRKFSLFHLKVGFWLSKIAESICSVANVDS